jgi:hypothetical protein
MLDLSTLKFLNRVPGALPNGLPVACILLVRGLHNVPPVVSCAPKPSAAQLPTAQELADWQRDLTSPYITIYCEECGVQPATRAENTLCEECADPDHHEHRVYRLHPDDCSHYARLDGRCLHCGEPEDKLPPLVTHYACYPGLTSEELACVRHTLRGYIKTEPLSTWAEKLLARLEEIDV